MQEAIKNLGHGRRKRITTELWYLITFHKVWSIIIHQNEVVKCKTFITLKM